MTTISVRSTVPTAGFWHFMLGEFVPLLATIATEEPDTVDLYCGHQLPFLGFYDELTAGGIEVRVHPLENAGSGVAQLPRWDRATWRSIRNTTLTREHLDAARRWATELATGLGPPEATSIVVQRRDADPATGRALGRENYGPDRRNVTNLDDVASALAAEHGGTPVSLTSALDKSILEQIRDHADAAVLVLGHGAGAAHMCWMQPGGLVVEIVPRAKLSRLGAPALGSTLGLRVERLVVEHKRDVVDVDAVRALVASHLVPTAPRSPAPAKTHRRRPPRHSARLVENLKTLDQFAITWEELTGRPSREPHPLQASRLHLHIPKTGGTTFQAIMARNHAPGHTVHVNAPRLSRDQTVAALTASALARESRGPGRPPAKFAVTGHHHIHGQIYGLIRSPFVHMTILRDPIRRVISHHRYLRTSPNHGMHRLAMDKNLRDFVLDTSTHETTNGQTWRLAGGPRAQRGEADEALLARAKENLASRFTLFGLTEQYDAFLVMCHRVLKWNEILYLRRNVTPPAAGSNGASEVIDDETMATITEANRLDIELYGFAVDLFEERLSQVAITPADVARFRTHNTTYGELVARPW
ncbi:MAG: sulfotransferase family 2 domain-containing protein [Acidimicrobiales bacterium]